MKVEEHLIKAILKYYKKNPKRYVDFLTEVEDCLDRAINTRQLIINDGSKGKYTYITNETYND